MKATVLVKYYRKASACKIIFVHKGVFIKDLSAYVVKSVDDMMKILMTGQAARRVGATEMNAGSSR